MKKIILFRENTIYRSLVKFLPSEVEVISFPPTDSKEAIKEQLRVLGPKLDIATCVADLTVTNAWYELTKKSLGHDNLDAYFMYAIAAVTTQKPMMDTKKMILELYSIAIQQHRPDKIIIISKHIADHLPYQHNSNIDYFIEIKNQIIEELTAAGYSDQCIYQCYSKSDLIDFMTGNFRDEVSPLESVCKIIKNVLEQPEKEAVFSISTMLEKQLGFLKEQIIPCYDFLRDYKNIDTLIEQSKQKPEEKVWVIMDRHYLFWFEETGRIDKLPSCITIMPLPLENLLDTLKLQLHGTNINIPSMEAVFQAVASKLKTIFGIDDTVPNLPIPGLELG